MQGKLNKSWFRKFECMHPYQTMVYLSMFGSGLLFLFLTFSFLLTRLTGKDPLEFENFTIPFSFIASTVILLKLNFVLMDMVN